MVCHDMGGGLVMLCHAVGQRPTVQSALKSRFCNGPLGRCTTATRPIFNAIFNAMTRPMFYFHDFHVIITDLAKNGLFSVGTNIADLADFGFFLLEPILRTWLISVYFLFVLPGVYSLLVRPAGGLSGLSWPVPGCQPREARTEDWCHRCHVAGHAVLGAGRPS